MDPTTVKTILKIQGFASSETIYLPCNTSAVLRYLKDFDCIYETHIVTGIAYGDVTLVKICIKLDVDPIILAGVIKNSNLCHGPIIIDSDSDSDL